MAQPSPSTIIRASLRVAVASGTGSLVVVTTWALEVFDGRPMLTLMVYLALIAAATGGGIVAAVAWCHLSVGHAFSAGLRAGRLAGPERDDGTRRLHSVN